MKLTLGFSPCPNDTFIFDALVNNKIDTRGYQFEIVLEDVQTLNQWALHKKLDISKISYGVLPLILENYTLLNSGGALGKGVGPLLISLNEIKNNKKPKDHPEESTGIGLKNLSARYRLFCQKDISIEMSDHEFIVKLPLIQQNLQP